MTASSTPRSESDSPSSGLASFRCLPCSLCSWDFKISGDIELASRGQEGSLQLGWFGEEGSVTVAGVHFAVKKHGMLSGHWTLRYEGEETISAKKCSAFTRTFELDAPGGPLLLRAESPLTRCFRLERGEETIATIRPDHPLTRRATIQVLSPDWDAPEIFFAFWLVVLMWRRAAQNNGG